MLGVCLVGERFPALGHMSDTPLFVVPYVLTALAEPNGNVLGVSLLVVIGMASV